METRLYLIEKVKYPCKLFIDVDNVNVCMMSDIKSRLSHDDVIICSRNVDNKKIGLHIIFQKTVVMSPEDAYTKAYKLLGPLCDKSVYKTGLRMIGSHKNYEIARMYAPYENERITPGDVANCSILIPRVSKNTPSSISEIPKNPKISNASVSGAVLNFSVIHPNYENVNVTNVFWKDKQRRNIVVRTLSHFCTNIQKCHNNQFVYFLVNTHPHYSVEQMCYGTSTHKSCSKYKSEKKRLPVLTFINIRNMIGK